MYSNVGRREALVKLTRTMEHAVESFGNRTPPRRKKHVFVHLRIDPHPSHQMHQVHQMHQMQQMQQMHQVHHAYHARRGKPPVCSHGN